MPPQYYPPNPPPPQWPSMKSVAVTMLVVLSLLIAWLALHADRPPAVDPYPPAQSTSQAGVTEQRLTLTDGRTLTCLSFPGPAPAVSCDWSRAYHR